MSELPPDIKAAAESALKDRTDISRALWPSVLVGVTWLYEYLLTLGGDGFDEKAAHDEAMRNGYDSNFPVMHKVFEKAAAWQHSQLQPVIAALRAERDSYHHDFRVKYDIETKKLHQEVEKLKAELAKAKSYDLTAAVLVKDIDEIEKLKAQLKDHHDDWKRVQDAERERDQEREINKIYEQALERQTHPHIEEFCKERAKEALEKAKGMRGK